MADTHDAAAGERSDNAAGERSETTNKIQVSCSTEYKEYTYNEKHDIWTLVSLKAPCQDDDGNEDARAPIDVVAVIDKSGSMSGAKLNLVKKTLEFVLTQLSDKDRLSVVTYDTQVYLDFELRKMNKDNKSTALEKIRSIRDGSCTNLCGGLMKGLCQIIQRAPEDKNEVASVLLFTDGLANEGIRSAAGIVKAMKNPAKFDGPSSGRRPPLPNQTNAAPPPHQSWLQNVFGGSGKKEKESKSPEIPPQEPNEENKAAEASVYTFGFGADHNPEMLKEISDAGNGMYYYIENEDKIAESFGHCVGGLLSTVAQGIQLQVSLADGVLIKEVHSGRPYEQSADKKSVKINAGDFQSEESRDFVIELTIDAVNAPYETTGQPLYEVSVDYFSVITNDLENESETLSVLRSEKAVVHDATNSNVRVNNQRARIKMTQAMKSANAKADSGDLEGARSTLLSEIQGLRQQGDSVRRDAVENEDEYLSIRDGYENMASDLEQCSSNLQSTSAWNLKGKKVQMNMMQQNVAQRSSNVTSSAYQTKGKKKRMAMAKKYVEEEE